MDLIIETDIGHDPDDFFAICYLAAAGVNIRTILISPGDPDQIAIAKFLSVKLGLDIPIGVAQENRTKLSSGSIHHHLLTKYGFPLEGKGDGLGVDILQDVFKKYPDSEIFVIGPVTSVGNYLKRSGRKVKRATMQGGFLAYKYHAPILRVPQFEGKTWMPTFNLNGDRNAGVAFLAADIEDRRMVGKNVCHTVLYDKTRHDAMKMTDHPAVKLFHEASEYYFQHHDFKKFHDPTAACLHLHPELGTWVQGKTVKMESGWGTQLDPEGDHILAEVDYTGLWDHILNWK